MDDTIKNTIEYVPTVLSYVGARGDASLMARDLAFQNNIGNIAFRNRIAVGQNDIITLGEATKRPAASANIITIRPNSLFKLNFEGSDEERYFAHISIPNENKNNSIHLLYSFGTPEGFGEISSPKYIGFRLNRDNSQVVEGNSHEFLSRVTKLQQNIPISSITIGVMKSETEP